MAGFKFAALGGAPKKVKLLLYNSANKYSKDENGLTTLNYSDEIYTYLEISNEIKSELRELLIGMDDNCKIQPCHSGYQKVCSVCFCGAESILLI